jgi:hypothetical protein
MAASRLRGWEAQHVAPIDPDDRIEPCGVRLPHAPESGFGQVNHPIIMDDEICMFQPLRQRDAFLPTISNEDLKTLVAVSRISLSSAILRGGGPKLACASQFVFVERDRAVIVQATKFLAPFLIDDDLVATFVKVEHVRADALERYWLARHPGVGCDETRQKADADYESTSEHLDPVCDLRIRDSHRQTTSRVDMRLSAGIRFGQRSLHDPAHHADIDLGGSRGSPKIGKADVKQVVHAGDVAARR